MPSSNGPWRPGMQQQGIPFLGQQERFGGGGGRMRRPPPRIQPATAQLPSDLWRLEITVAKSEENKLRRYHWNGWNRGAAQDERPEVMVTVKEGGVTYTNVALHLKGSAGSFQPYDGKPGMTLNFTKHAKDRTFHGLTKLSLNNSVQDPSFISDQICRELFVAAGVPAPKADHATVVLNGRDLGLYVLSEGWAKPFIKRHFPNGGGTLYEGGFVQDVSTDMEPKDGNTKTDLFRKLIKATSDNNPTNRWNGLKASLDVDRFISLMAMEVLVVHWDGYCLNRNNYRILHDHATDRLVFLPHGMDQMFGVTRASPDMPVDSPMQGMVARAVMSTREGRKLYFERLASLQTNVFVEARMLSRVDEISARIKPTLAAYGPEWVREHEMFVRDLRDRISERSRSLAQQLSSPPGEIEFNAEGIARMTGWRPRTVNQGGGEIRYEREDRDGKVALKISLRRGGGTGSWRSSTTLLPGNYRFEGRVQASGTGRNSGVCLRVSGARVSRTQPIDGDWMPLSFDFSVDGPASGVELVAEFSGEQGEATFDQAAMILKRLP